MTDPKENTPGATEGVNKAGRPFIYTQYTGTVDISAIGAGSDSPRYEVYLAGWAAGYSSRDSEVQGLNWTADRLYTWACARTAPKFAEQPPFASLERIRGNPEHADEVDAANAARFEQVAR